MVYCRFFQVFAGMRVKVMFLREMAFFFDDKIISMLISRCNCYRILF